MTKERQDAGFGMDVTIGFIPPEDMDQLMGGAAMPEVTNQPLGLPEISPERAATYIERDPNEVYGFFCSDDRNATDASMEQLGDKYGITTEAYLRGFGGATGVTRRLLTAIAVHYGDEALQAYGTSFNDFKGETISRIQDANPNVVLGDHSAEGNEDSATTLNTDSEKGLGCAYCAGVGAVTGLCQPDSPLVELARTEEALLFGDDAMVDPVTKANLAVQQQFFPEEKAAFSLDRADLAALDMPVMILAGSHAPAAQVEVALNFDATKVSQPAVANEANVPFYDIDTVAEAEMVMRAYPELKLQPRILLAVIEHDARAVREALASSEGLHADAMKLVRNGSLEDATAYLDGLQI